MVRRRAGLLAGATALGFASLVAVPMLLPGRAASVAGHSGLVAVIPAGAAEEGELRLVFSEALEPTFSGADLVDGSGQVVTPAVGRLDATDHHVMIVAAPQRRTDGDLLVSWRALSAADGHVTGGTVPLSGAAVTEAGSDEAELGEHGGGHLSLEVLAKILAFGGLLVALGLFPFGRYVVRPATGTVPRGLPLTQANALILGAVGGALLLAVSQLELAAAGTIVDPLTYVAGNRIGTLLALRAAIPLVGGLAGAVLVRRGAEGRASAVSAMGALAALILTALSGHAAAYASPIPSLVDLAHLVAASVWLGGLVGFAGMIGGPSPLGRAEIRAMVPRFSALALTSVALLGMTGLYAAWLATGDWTRIDTPYSFGLALKVGLVAAAFGVGALNYLDGGRDLRIGGGLSRRIVLEAAIAATVIVATASLTATDPPALTRAVPIATTDGGGSVTLSLAPGRAGANLVIVEGPVPVGARIELRALEGASATGVALASLDGLPGTAAAFARTEPGNHLGATATIPAGRWQASVLPDGTGPPIGQFAFTLDATGLTDGRRLPPLPPPLLAGAGLLLLAALAAAAAARGITVPLIEPATGRASLAAFSVVGGLLGIAMLTLGPRA